MDYYYDYSGLFGVWSVWAIVFIIICIGLNVGLAFVVANMARKKGYSYGGFWCLSFFCGFFIPLIVVLCLEDKNVQKYPPQYQQPYGQPYQPPYGQPYSQPVPPPQFQGGFCSSCGSPIAQSSAFCSKCGARQS